MRLVSYRHSDGALHSALASSDGGYADVRDVSDGSLPADPGELLRVEGWDERLRALGPLPSTLPEALELGAPQPQPGKVVAAGLNYRDHATESKAPIPVRPLLFAKWPSAIVGPDAPVVAPDGESKQLDYEAELAVVIGRHCRHAHEEDALSYVGGYTIANDVSARDVQFRDGQWTLGKSYDTFCPLGPAIVTTDEIPDPQSLPIAATVNGELRQQSTTAEMIFSVAELIAYVSARVTMHPGDLLLTGTPAGVALGFEPPRWLRAGDRVSCSIEPIGILTNTIADGEELR